MPNQSRETKFSCANEVREVFIFPVQLTTSRIGNLTRLILTLAICVTIHSSGITNRQQLKHRTLVTTKSLEYLV